MKIFLFCRALILSILCFNIFLTDRLSELTAGLQGPPGRPGRGYRGPPGNVGPRGPVGVYPNIFVNIDSFCFQLKSKNNKNRFDSIFL